jgi:Raf kinase inhibitor-like YbhB/YbcL family protein
MRLTSTDFENGGTLETRHGKKFDDVSPQLASADVPSGAASMALTMVDTHPVARGYVHWFVDELPPTDGEIAVGGDKVAGREIKPYVGPFPPSGTHEYLFTLYALDASAPRLAANSSVATFLELVEGHVLATAELTGSFTKPRA